MAAVHVHPAVQRRPVEQIDPAVRCRPGALAGVGVRRRPAGGSANAMIESPDFVAVLAAAPGRDHDVLPAVDHVQARRRVAACRQLVLPEHASRALFERPDFLVRRGGDEDHAAGRRHRAAEVERSGVANALRDELRVLAERHLPDNLPLDEIDGVERAPGRRDRRHAVRIEEQRIAIDRVAIGNRRRSPARVTSPGGVFRNARQRARARAAGIVGTPAWRCGPAR